MYTLHIYIYIYIYIYINIMYICRFSMLFSHQPFAAGHQAPGATVLAMADRGRVRVPGVGGIRW